MITFNINIKHCFLIFSYLFNDFKSTMTLVAPLNTTQRQKRIRYNKHFDEIRVNKIMIRDLLL